MKSIIFNDEMVRAWMAGRKDVTRRPIKGCPDIVVGDFLDPNKWYAANKGDFAGDPDRQLKPPFTPGERIYIRETWSPILNGEDCLHYDDELKPCPCGGCHIEYRADSPSKYPGGWPDDSKGDPDCAKWKPSIHMPEWASRSHALIVSVRPERIRDITEEEARREGIIDGGCLNCGNSEPCGCPDPKSDARDAFIWLWKKLYQDSWDRNEWVFRIELAKEG